jgi:hypothetical protein
MKDRFEEILKDLDDHHFHDDLDTASKIIKDCYAKLKCQPDPYSRIYWYYENDAVYAKEEDLDVRQMKYYSGILIPPPFDRPISSFEPFEDGIVIVDQYPTEMCEPDVDWICLKRLLQNEELVEVYQ